MGCLSVLEVNLARLHASYRSKKLAAELPASLLKDNNAPTIPRFCSAACSCDGRT